MFKIKKRTAILVNNSKKDLRVIQHKDLFINGLKKIFSKEPSALGYKNDIEKLINETDIKDEDFLYLTELSLLKIARSKDDIRIISSYLYSMPNLIKLLKGNDIEKKEQDIMKDLFYLSKCIIHQKFSENHIITRFGEIGTTAYIILKGNANVLLKNFKILNITKYDYLYYLANLIRYNEYGLLNEAINENFYTFPIDIEESFKNDDIFKTKEKSHNYTEEFPFIKNSNENIFPFFNKLETDQSALKNSILKNETKTNIKLNINYVENILYKKAFKITEARLLKLFNLKKIPIDNLHCSSKIYIDRLKILPDDFKFHINDKIKKEIEEEERKLNEERNKKEKKEEFNENTFHYFKIYSYSKSPIVMNKGAFFGELALIQENSLRTATIITSKDCDMTIITKKTFNNCLRKGAAVYIKKLLLFFINLPIFRGISDYFFYNKYYSYLSKKIMTRGNILVNQGESPKGFIILYSGTYNIRSKISLNSLTNLILHLIKINLDTKIEDNSDTQKYRNLLKKITKLSEKTQFLINENKKFAKFYNNEMNIRVTELSSPDIIGIKEYVNEKGLYSFTIEARSTENIYYILDNKLLSAILHKNQQIKQNEEEFSEKKVNVMINRLIILRNCLVQYFFNNKDEKINNIISKELDIINDIKIKQKSSLKSKTSEYNIKIDKKEPEKRNKKIFIENEPKPKNFSYNLMDTSNNNTSKNKNIITPLSTSKLPKTSSHINKKIVYYKVKEVNKLSQTRYKTVREKRYILEPKKSQNIKDNIQKFNKTYKESFYKREEFFRIKYNLNDRNKLKMKFPRFSSSLNSHPQNMKSAGIILNDVVLEELNEKIQNDLLLNNNSNSYSANNTKSSKFINPLSAKSNLKNKNERLISPLTPTNFNKRIFQNKYKYLRRSGTQSLFNRMLRIKPKSINNILNNKTNEDSKTNKTNFISNKTSLNILNIKKIFSPLEMSLQKYKANIDNNKLKKNKENHKDKTNKFKSNKLYTNNIIYKIKQYYNNCKKEKNDNISTK